MRYSYMLLFSLIALYFSSCNTESPKTAEPAKPAYGGYTSKVEWGEHLVKSNMCGDCHSPKVMTEKGLMEIDSLFLSGYHPSASVPDFHRAEAEKKGYAIMNEQITAFAGPWGVSFAANLTSDPTGIGNWEEETFIIALREGKYKGIHSGRDLLPPMPWQYIRHHTDEELKAMFAYLKSTKPVRNLVPAPMPPTKAAKM